MTKEKAIRSARSSGAVGKNAIVPRIIPKLVGTGGRRILDFGCGADMIHVVELQKQGLFVVGYDWSLPETKKFITDELYDIIYLSNVLNVQSSEEMLEDLFKTVISCMRYMGFVVANYPYEPRYLGWSTKEMLEWLQVKFTDVIRLNKSLAGNNIVWLMR